jgi:hypothetical protein
MRNFCFSVASSSDRKARLAHGQEDHEDEKRDDDACQREQLVSVRVVAQACCPPRVNRVIGLY